MPPKFTREYCLMPLYGADPNSRRPRRPLLLRQKERNPVSKIIRTSSTGDARQALGDFKNLAAIIGPSPKGTDARHIIRLLAATHHPEVPGTLRFLDDSAAVWPTLVKKLLQHTSESQFRQTLAELRVLAHLNRQPGVQAQSVRTPKDSKHHDIDAMAGGVAAKIEIYSPSGSIGSPLVDQHISPLFKFLDVPVGFHLALTLEPLARASVSHASEIGTASQIARWLTRILEDAQTWINASTAVGASKSWNGPNKSVRLTVVVHKISDDRADRVVMDMTGTRSTDTHAFFNHGDPQQLRFSPWGKKVFEKMSKRQCGEYEEGKIRLLTLDFGGLDTSSKDFFRATTMGIFSRIECALKIAAKDAGESIPYDGLILTRADRPAGCAPCIEINPAAGSSLRAFTIAANLAGSLVDHS
jgi:hypothetical protein